MQGLKSYSHITTQRIWIVISWSMQCSTVTCLCVCSISANPHDLLGCWMKKFKERIMKRMVVLCNDPSYLLRVLWGHSIGLSARGKENKSVLSFTNYSFLDSSQVTRISTSLPQQHMSAFIIRLWASWCIHKDNRVMYDLDWLNLEGNAQAYCKNLQSGKNLETDCWQLFFLY